nr:NAD(P)/FAD-dependent oxidoreductase [Candidatus Freyarchaeota archaeon]
MNGKTIIIIGAGLAGLSTGCYAQMNGYQSQIFEQHSEPGGLAACWKRKEYLIDGGIHFMMGYKPGVAIYDVLREVGADRVHYIDTPVYTQFIDEASGRTLEVTSDLDKLDNDFRTLFPEDKKFIKEIISGARAVSKKDISSMGFEKPAELMGLRDKIGMTGSMLGLMKYFMGKYAKPVRQYAEKIHDLMFRDILMNLFSPDAPVWFTLMVLGIVAAGQLGLIEDGSQEFARSIERHYAELEGKVTYRANVEEILVENDQAVGVRLEDGSAHRSDYVISAADGYHTLYELLAGRYVNEEIEKRYRTWKPSPPIVLFSFGVAQEFKKDPWLKMIKLEKPITIGNREIDIMTVRIFNYSSKFAPPGKTVIQPTFETDWNYWFELRKDKQKYDAEKQRLAAEVLERLEKHYPGIKSKVEVTDIATPHTYWRYTRNREGSIMGWPPSAETMFAQIEKTLPGLTNFYMAGQWSMSTGGVLSSISSGRHVIQLICHKEGKRFRNI